jgi:hypothetical protein
MSHPTLTRGKTSDKISIGFQLALGAQQEEIMSHWQLSNANGSRVLFFEVAK